MFRFAKQREVLWPVTIKVPADGGAVSVGKILVRYKLLTRAEMREAVQTARREGDDVSEEAARADTAWIASRITGWDDVVDDVTGEPLAFTAENLAAVLDLPYVAVALAAGLWDASQGAPAKN